MSAEHPPDDGGFYPTFAALLETPEERKEWVEALLRVYGKTRRSEQPQTIASALGDALPSEYPLFQKSVNHAH